MLGVLIVSILFFLVVFIIIYRENKRSERARKVMDFAVRAENVCRAANTAPKVDECVIRQTSKEVAQKGQKFIVNNIKNINKGDE